MDAPPRWVPVFMALFMLPSLFNFSLHPDIEYTGSGCISNIANPPQIGVNRLLFSLEHYRPFIYSTSGACYFFDSKYDVTGPGYYAAFLVLYHYTPHVVYPCGGDTVTHDIDRKLEASPKISQNGTIIGFSLRFEYVHGLTYYCPASSPGVAPVELSATNDTEHSRENIAISLISQSESPIVGLNVTLQLPLGTYDKAFTGVTNSTPLNFGQVANATLTLPLESMKTWTVYSMTESAVLKDGSRPQWNVHVELEG